MAETSEQRVYVDRIEGDMAVLVEDTDQGHEIPILRSRLPEGTREGQWLRVDVPAHHQGSVRAFLAAADENSEEAPHFTRDDAAGEAVKGRVQNLMDQLSG